MRRQIALALLALAACAPDNKSPVDVVVLSYNSTTNKYEPRKVSLKTVKDLVTMDGDIASFAAGAKIVIDDKDPALQRAANLDQVKKAILKNEGGPVKVSWVADGSTLVPADFHSLNIVTSYYNLERAKSVYQRIGDDLGSKFGKRTVYYFADYSENGQAERDNASFNSLLQSFQILPFDQLQMIPFSINGGVVAHEFQHAVFNFRVFNGAAVPAVKIAWASDTTLASATPGLNLLAVVEEGLADVFGTAATCDDTFANCSPAFFGKSLPGSESSQRNIDTPHCLSAIPEVYDDMRSKSYDLFALKSGEQYRIGSVLSSSLWSAAGSPALTNALGGSGPARKAVLLAVSKAMSDGIASLINDNAGNQTYFTLEGVLGAIVASAATDSKDVKDALCASFLEFFSPKVTQISGCPSVAAPRPNCQ